MLKITAQFQNKSIHIFVPLFLWKFYVDKCNLTTQRCWFSCSGWRGCLAVSGLSQQAQAYMLRFTQVTRLRVAAIWNHVGKSVVFFVFSQRCVVFSSAVVFCLPSVPPPLFVFFFISFHCYHSMTGAWTSLCVGAHGWVAGIASHGSVLLSRGWLISVQARGHPRHPPSTQLDAVVKHGNRGCFLQ